MKKQQQPERILLVAATTGYQTRSFAEAARRLGVEVVLATDRCHVLEDPWGDCAIPIRFEEPEESVRALAGVDVDGIVAVGDRPALIAAMAAERLGIPMHPASAVAVCRNKHTMRERLQRAGLPVPWFGLAKEAEPGGFPCVVKPIALSASRGVIRVNNSAEFRAALARVRAILHDAREPEDAIQVEEYIDGREFALEGLMTDGELLVLAIFDKPDPLNGPFFEETIYVTPSRESQDVQNAIAETTKRAVRALGLRHGPIHAEMRVNDRGVWMLEIAARPIGGLCARGLRFEGGITLEELVLLHAAGRMPRRIALSPPGLGVMMIPIPRAGVYRSVAGVEEALRVAGVDDVVITAKEGQELIPLPEGASYLGFIFSSGQNACDAESALRTAHSRLNFEIAASLDIFY